MLRFLTAGESHGPGLVVILDRMPAGLELNLDRVNEELWRRQQGYGRGNRQKIETDQVESLGGIRHGITSGAPIALLIRNKDWENWEHVMSSRAVDPSMPEVQAQLGKKSITRFRPGHADLAGTLKFRQRDIRDVLERASARETAARVAAGAICAQLLAAFDISIAAHVIQVGHVKAVVIADNMPLQDLDRLVSESPMFCADAEATEAMTALIKSAWQSGDSLGGVVEVLADGLPVGLGSYTQWDEKLDGLVAQALMSVQAIKAVEVGDGVASAGKPGSLVHDPISPATVKDGPFPFERQSNHAGGIEGGMSNGQRLITRAYMKPIPTLRKGLSSVSYPEFAAATAHFERSDVCAISAASVVCKAMVSFVLARALIDKFGGDTVTDMKVTIDNYRAYCRMPAKNCVADKIRANTINGQEELEADTE